jgi:hypothetical protein
MIGYKDRTWCDAHECSKFEVCDRAYTQKEKERAIKWWGQPSVPVSFYLNPQVLKCYVAPQSVESQPRSESLISNTTN